MKVCCYCEKNFSDEECRPYGIDGADTCFPCAMKPENKERAEQQMHARIDEALRLGNGSIFIGHHSGPIPMNSDDVGNN